MEGMLAAAPFESNNSITSNKNNVPALSEEEEDFWCELIKKANELDIQKTELTTQEVGEIDKVDLSEEIKDDDLIKDYLIEEYTKEIESYQTLLIQKEKEVYDWREKYEADIADLNSQIDRLNEENELLTKTLCEQQELYTTRENSTDSLVETHKEPTLEDYELETKEEHSVPLLTREFEHHLILSAWNALRSELVMQHNKN